MEARDFRSIGRAAQEELRRRALVLILQQGLSQAQAAEVVGVQRQTVNIWLKRYRAQGADGVLGGRRVSPRRGKGLLDGGRRPARCKAGSATGPRTSSSCLGRCGPAAPCAT